jgi:hypothetical protein
MFFAVQMENFSVEKRYKEAFPFRKAEKESPTLCDAISSL